MKKELRTRIEASKGCPCVDCPSKNGCYLIVCNQPTDVIRAPCGRAIGYNEPSEGSSGFWVAPMKEWESVKGTRRRPKGISFIFWTDYYE